MRFSDRIGVTTPSKLLQIESIDEPLRNALWQFCRENILYASEYRPLDPSWGDRYRSIYVSIYTKFYKKTEDDMPDTDIECVGKIRGWYFKAKWYELYNFIEFLFSENEGRKRELNVILAENRSAYRFIDGQLAPISDALEADAIAAAASVPEPFAGARTHIAAALAAFSKRPVADYRNTIREAISAVESAAKVVACDEAAELGDAIKAIEKTHGMHPAFKQAVIKLYAYTNDEKGIRHALLEEAANVDEADAHFMIVACAAFVNFLVQK